MVKNRIVNNVETIFEISEKENISSRKVGMKMAKERVIMAMKAKGIWKNR
jgi:glutamate dehydrogenase/leucine dehydrogenase